MLGYFKPIMKELCEKDKETYKIHYCTVCNAINKRYSKLATILLQNEAVFLSIIDKENEDLEKIKKINCPVFQFKKVNIFEHEIDYIKYADLSLLTVYIAVIDKQVEGNNSIKNKIFYKIFEKDFKKNSEYLKYIFDYVNIFNEIKKELKDEKNKGILTVNKMSYIYSEIVKKISCENEVLANVGFYVCKIMYLLDAFEDYFKDKQKKEFNILREIEYKKIPEYVKFEIINSIIKIKEKLNENNIVSNVLELSLQSKFNKIKQKEWRRES